MISSLAGFGVDVSSGAVGGRSVASPPRAAGVSQTAKKEQQSGRRPDTAGHTVEIEATSEPRSPTRFRMTTMKRLLATASLLVSASGFVSRPRVGGAEATASSRSTSDCNMLQPEKFDRVIETKRTSIGYDSDSGRFFEMQNGPDSVLTESVESVSVESTSLVDPESTPSDIPPIPDAGFDGMNITGEINGVKMTSRGSPRRKQETNLLADGDSSSSDQAQTEDGNGMRSKTFADRITNSGAVSAAAVATAAVNAAVSMKTLTAPSVDKSYISLDSAKEVDGEGLPLTYDKDLIEAYWAKERGALNQRWSYFVGKAVPFLTRLVTLFISGGGDQRAAHPRA
ncbi:hypothetical protein THAOC_13756 [Thalassiosira oceanica]|uniref:Uncharacterized protein n=1 Tax=Thalassiosira oceanica TaxID=159749 RepID=K0SJ59_THAOC|nr:hypothetical protein THAOC_13756 [Thalassiosira oceanica]|eukprot:EJK65385.1 hypothetical protein THAOC_13756 [Thalassiosira oceanica]